MVYHIYGGAKCKTERGGWEGGGARLWQSNTFSVLQYWHVMFELIWNRHCHTYTNMHVTDSASVQTVAARTWFDERTSSSLVLHKRLHSISPSFKWTSCAFHLHVIVSETPHTHTHTLRVSPCGCINWVSVQIYLWSNCVGKALTFTGFKINEKRSSLFSIQVSCTALSLVVLCCCLWLKKNQSTQ